MSVETNERFLLVDGSGKRVVKMAFDENYKINLIRTLTYRCLRICSSPCLLQSALDDLKWSGDGLPRGIISYNMNDVVNKHRNKPKDIITVPPPKENFHCFTLSRYSNQNCQSTA